MRYTVRCEPYNLLEYFGDDWHESGLSEKPPDDAWEYTATLFDENGNDVDTFDSFPEGYSGSGQFITLAQAEKSCREIERDVAAGNASRWFTLLRR